MSKAKQAVPSVQSPTDNLQKLASLKRELLELQLEKYAGRLKNVRSIFHKRKEIARLKTIVNANAILITSKSK